MKVHSTNLAFHMWDELTILRNDLTIDWNDLTMERNDRIPNMCNKKKVLFFFGRGGTHQLELQQRKSETLAISRGQIAVMSP